MNFDSTYNKAERSYIVHGSIDQRELLAKIRDKEMLMAEIRYQLAKAIVDQLMIKIKPALDNILKE